MIDLGDAETVDHCIADLRASITGEPEDSRSPPSHSDVDAGTALRQRIFDPLQRAIGGSWKVVVSPDGNLATLPLEVLPADDETCLIDSFEFSYLSSGRDLLRMARPRHGPAGASIVAADPDFDLTIDRGIGGASTDPAPTERISRDLDFGQGVEGLPGTRQEGEAIANLLGVRPWLDADLVEARFGELRSPAILHLATHGFFLKDQAGLRAPLPGAAPSRIENPMLRSGLLLAGFNTWLSRGFVPADVVNAVRITVSDA